MKVFYSLLFGLFSGSLFAAAGNTPQTIYIYLFQAVLLLLLIVTPPLFKWLRAESKRYCFYLLACRHKATDHPERPE